jgi:hypothetical protein
MRGLRPVRGLKGLVVSRAQLKKMLQSRLVRGYTTAEIEASGQVLVRLGLIASNPPYLQQIHARLARRVAGFYDPKTKQLVVADDLSKGELGSTVLHELCHAGQDRAYKLRRFARRFKSDSDRQLARQALMEGDCAAVAVDAAYRKQGVELGSLGGSFAKLRRVLVGPPAKTFIDQMMRMPYAAGLSFVYRVRRKHDVWMVARIFRRPPRTSEQLLHYGKYWRRERAHRIRVRGLPSLKDVAKQAHNDRLGEAQIQAYLAHHLGHAIAARAAEGWGGDRLVAFRFEPKKQQRASPTNVAREPALVWQTSWDTAADAREFENAQQRVFRARGFALVGSQNHKRGGLSVFKDQKGLLWSIQRHRNAVLTLMGFAEKLQQSLQKEVWSRWRVRGRALKPPTASER